jgi:LmbE family N-acetylglucosaminyl deacetylase
VKNGSVSLDILAKPERHLFFSPHYDDIALSCGGVARLLANQRRTPVIVLLFGSEPDPGQPLTSFAEGMHRQWGMEASEVISGRRREEAAASAILGAEGHFAPFHDAIYRGDHYVSDEQLFGAPASDEADLPRQIVDSLALGGVPDSTMRVYAPLAVGNHVDHQTAFRVGTELAQAGWDVWFYEDLPYALKSGARERRIAACGFSMSEAAIVDVGDVWQSKIDAIMAYPSQLAVIFDYVRKGHSRDQIEAVMRTYATEIGGNVPAERFWKLA